MCKVNTEGNMQISNKEVENLAYEVNALLTLYIAAHEYRLHEAATLRSLFRKVDFENIQKRIEDVHLVALQIQKKVEGLFDYDLTDQQDTFSRLLLNFNQALLEAIERLLEVSTAQLEKSRGKGSLTLQQSLKLDHAYDESVKNYLSHGEKLNAAMHLVSA